MLLALTLLVLLLPFGTAIASADSPQPATSTQPVSLVLMGGVVNAGHQTYRLSGGQLVGASIFGQPIMPGTGSVFYEMHASVSGLSAVGWSYLVASGQSEITGGQVYLTAWGHINESIPAAEFPLVSTDSLGCQAQGICTSEIPAEFIGLDQVFVSIRGVQQQYVLPIGIESAYLNPFGGPIVIASLESADPAIQVMANYSSATIQWKNVLMEGNATGTFGATPVNGVFSMNVRSFENLVTGVEHDRGQIVLMGVTPNGIPAEGRFQGVSTIPTPTQGSSCPTSLRFPAGTCTETGLLSAGSMSLHSGNIHISGTYQTQWTAPALAFGSMVNATAIFGHNHHGSSAQLGDDNHDHHDHDAAGQFGDDN